MIKGGKLPQAASRDLMKAFVLTDVIVGGRDLARSALAGAVVSVAGAVEDRAALGPAQVLGAAEAVPAGVGISGVVAFSLSGLM